MAYQNPIPSLDDEYEAKVYSLTFEFKKAVTLKEAVEGVNNVIAENGGKISEKWLHMGKDRRIRYALPQKKKK